MKTRSDVETRVRIVQMKVTVLKMYLETQILEIMKYKWIRSEELGYDIGAERAAQEWVDKYAASFSSFWKSTHSVETGLPVST